MFPPIQLMGYGPVVFDSRLPASWKGKILPGGEIFYYQGPAGTIMIQEYQQEHWCIRYAVFRFFKKMILHWTQEAAICFRFVLQGHLKYRGDDKKFYIRSGRVNMSWAPGRQNYAIVARGEEYIILNLHYSPLLVSQLLPRFPAGLAPEQSSTLIERQWQDTINELMDAPYGEGTLRFFFENKVRDILLFLLSQPGTGERFEGLTQEEVEKVYEVDRMILNDLGTWLHIPQLAKKVGLSQFKLKLAYPRVMGCNMFERLRLARLEKGRLLLLETDLQVKVIFREAGYKSLSGFEDAFREKYGLPPLQYRKKYQPGG